MPPARHFSYLVEKDRYSGKAVHEADTATCRHCSHVMVLPPAKDGHIIVRVQPCSICGGFICNECQKKGGCDPWEKWMEREEARARLHRAITE